MSDVDVEYYDMTGKELHIFLSPGDLIKICDVLHDYTDLLSILEEMNKENASHALFCRNYIGRLKKVQQKIESTIGYNVEDAIKKCNKKRAKSGKDDDIGQDALVLAVKIRDKKNESEKN